MVRGFYARGVFRSDPTRAELNDDVATIDVPREVAHDAGWIAHGFTRLKAVREYLGHTSWWSRCCGGIGPPSSAAMPRGALTTQTVHDRGDRVQKLDMPIRSSSVVPSVGPRAYRHGYVTFAGLSSGSPMSAGLTAKTAM
jgi:hypothetical protein